MSVRVFRHLPFIRTLRGQFQLALSVQALLIIAVGLTTVYGLHISSNIARQLAEERIVNLQDSQELVQHTQLIYLESHRLVATGSPDAVQASHLVISQKLDLLDATVQRLDQASNNQKVEKLRQASQLFRNSVQIVAQLQGNMLKDSSKLLNGTAWQQESIHHLHGELEGHTMSLVHYAQNLSAEFTLEYQEKLQQLTTNSRQEERWTLALFTCSVFLAWFLCGVFLKKRVIERLEQVSYCLRHKETSAGCRKVSVQGDDEISEMARAVEHFLDEHRLWAEAQHRLRQSENILQAVIDAAPVAIMDMDLEGNVLSIWNREAERMLGWSTQEVLGRSIPTVPAENMEEFKENLEQIRKGMSLNGIEVCNQRRDGTPLHYSIYSSPLYDLERNVSGNIVVLVDIAETKQAEAALVFEREQLLSIFDGLDQSVYVADPHTYEILYANQAVRKVFGKDLVGGVCYRELQGCDRPCHFCTNEFILENKPAPCYWEYFNQSVEKYFDITDRIISWPDGRDARLQIAVDITERKLLDEQLRNKNEDLERSNTELDEFAYIVSHDLKEPLRSIHSFSSFLLEDYGDRLDSEGQTHLGIVQQSASRMEALLDDLLIYSRVGRENLEKRSTDLVPIIAGVIDDMHLILAQENGHVSVAKDLPLIVCDHVRIGEVFRNLIQNGVKYNDAREKRIEVGWLAAEETKQGIPVFFVRDNGIGIREKHLDSIFKIFKRLHGRDKYCGGTGSGLTIVRKIVERHNGRIWVESNFGQGSTFYFTLAKGEEEGEDEG